MESTVHIFDGLTESQIAAVGHMDGPLLVLAGPGSGKTTVVTRRVGHLIAQGIPPWQILGLTFTNKAAGEMRQRIDSLIPPDIPGVRGLTIATFHAFCARLLRRYAHEAGCSERYSIYDTADQRDAIKRAMAAADLNPRNWTPASIGSAISNAKNELLDADAFARNADDFVSRIMARAYLEYERILKQNDALDFDDLLLKSAFLLRDNEGVRQELQDRYQYLLIDEYQDTNHAQFLVAGMLAAEHKNICVVGDPDQSIYAWRGADIANILDFERQYPDATIVPLGQNFRSTGHIVATAAELIQHNVRRKDKHLFTELDDGEKPTLVIARDEYHESRIIVDTLQKLNDDDGVPWKSMAVLYRVNALSRVLEEAFRLAHVPYVIARGTAFYERKEVKDALAYLRSVANPNDEVALRRIINTPPRGIGKTTLNAIELHAATHQMRFLDAMRDATAIESLTARATGAVTKFVTLLDGWIGMTNPLHTNEPHLLPSEPEPATLAMLVERIVRESGLEDLYKRSKNEEEQQRLENLEELISAAADFSMPLGEDEDVEEPDHTLDAVLRAYLESVALVSDADAIDPDNGAVTLMTLHAAKGLEFDAVCLAGLEHGMLPHMRAIGSEEDIEEERRLCFVGITRARRHLTMSHAAIRTHRGIRERTIPSQFIRDMESAPLLISDQSDTWDADAGQHSTASDIDDYDYDQTRGAYGEYDIQIGSHVRHPKFGRGIIEAITPRPAGSSARVRFDSVGSKTLLLEYAKLERLGD